MDYHLKIAIAAASAASKILRAGFRVAEKNIEDKKSGALTDVVTKYDYAAQRAILKILRRHFQSYDVLSEEGISIDKRSEYKWIIDPLDGSNNFSRGIPDFAVSIALTRRNKIILGVVALPYENEIYCASEKTPTHLNGRRVRVGQRKKLESATVGVSMLRSKEAVRLGLKTFVKLMNVPIKPRIFGAVAADLARVASGKLDAIIFNHAMPWDVAAGIILVEKAGGKVAPVIGKDMLRAKQLIASNQALHGQLLKLFKKA